MGARRNHYYYIDRYPLGLDATVFDQRFGRSQTMSWTNDTDYPVLIRGYKIRKGSSGYVRFELYSVPTGRTVVDRRAGRSRTSGTASDSVLSPRRSRPASASGSNSRSTASRSGAR